MPDLPSLSAVPDRALAAFLSVELFGATLHASPAAGTYTTGGQPHDPLEPAGALAVVEALDVRAEDSAFTCEIKPTLELGRIDKKLGTVPARSWQCSIRFGYHRPVHGWTATMPRAVCEAAALALYPEASAEARSLLAPSTHVS